jgi:hypothetical protein
MPITYTLDRERRRMSTRATGRLTFAELSAHLDEEEQDRAIGYAELFDARGASTDLQGDEVRRLVDRAQAILSRGGVVGATAVVADNDVVFGMARMYAMMAEFARAPVEVFRDLEPALAWLERHPPPEPREGDGG